MGSPVAIIGRVSGRNYIINGAMDFAQRIGFENAVNLGGGNTYYFDRWQSNFAGSWSVNPTIGQGPPASPTPDNLSAQVMSVAGTPSAFGSSVGVAQRIESIHAQDLANQVMSIGMWVFPNHSTCVINAGFVYPTAADNYGSNVGFFSGTSPILIPGQWNFVSFNNIAVPSGASNGVSIGFVFTNFGTTGVASTGFYLTEAMLNIGPVSNRFVRSGGNIVEELSLCQRYFEKSYDLGIPLANTGANGISSATAAQSGQLVPGIIFKTRKRSQPTFNCYSVNNGTLGKVTAFGGTDSGGSISFQTPSETGCGNIAGTFSTNTLYYYHWTADAEIA